MNSFTRKCFLVGGLFWLAITICITAFESRRPGTDVFLFKEAGVTLATEGNFKVSNLPHMPVDKPLTYGYYPPLYPFIYGIWSKVVGVGLKQSILFDSFLRLIRTLFILLLVWPVVSLTIRKRKSAAVLFVGFLLGLSLVSSDGDRPDELALIFGLGALYFLSVFRIKSAGLLLGLCGSTSPAGGIFFALISSFTLLSKRKIQPWFVLGVIAAFVFALINFPIVFSDPKMFMRFMEQASLSNFPYSLDSFSAFTESMGRILGFSLKWGMAHVFGVGILFALALFLRKTQDRALLYGVILFVALNIVIWTLQPYYLWFSLIGLLLFVLNSQKSFEIRMAGIYLALTPLLLMEVKGNLPAFLQEKEQKAPYISSRVLDYLKAEDTLAVDPDQYFTFRKHLKVDNTTYVCPRIGRYSYVYTTPRSARRTRQTPQKFPCFYDRECFEVVEDFSNAPVFTLFGMETPFLVRGNGGTLFRNKGCHLALR